MMRFCVRAQGCAVLRNAKVERMCFHKAAGYITGVILKRIESVGNLFVINNDIYIR